MNTQTSTITSDMLGAVVAGLDLDNELFGTTESDDDVDTTKSTSGVKSTDEPATTPNPVTTEPVVVATSTSKASIARALFVEHYNVKQRKDIVVLFEAVAGCTPKGAATYYQNFTKEVKDGKLVVKHTTKVVAEPTA